MGGTRASLSRPPAGAPIAMLTNGRAAKNELSSSEIFAHIDQIGIEPQKVGIGHIAEEENGNEEYPYLAAGQDCFLGRALPNGRDDILSHHGENPE
jgi:hypothetical protein